MFLPVQITPPIKIRSNSRYLLVIEDKHERCHYFNFSGEYDGWSYGHEEELEVNIDETI